MDDSRTTLGYAVTELRKDIAAELAMLSPEEQAKVPETALAIFVGETAFSSAVERS